MIIELGYLRTQYFVCAILRGEVSIQQQLLEVNIKLMQFLKWPLEAGTKSNLEPINSHLVLSMRTPGTNKKQLLSFLLCSQSS